MKITAEQARGLMPSALVATALQEIGQLIEEAAKRDQTSIRIPEKWLNHDGGDGAVSMSKEPIASIAKALQAQGFRIELFYTTAQFVDAGVKVNW